MLYDYKDNEYEEANQKRIGGRRERWNTSDVQGILLKDFTDNSAECEYNVGEKF